MKKRKIDLCLLAVFLASVSLACAYFAGEKPSSPPTTSRYWKGTNGSVTRTSWGYWQGEFRTDSCEGEITEAEVIHWIADNVVAVNVLHPAVHFDLESKECDVVQERTITDFTGKWVDTTDGQFYRFESCMGGSFVAEGEATTGVSGGNYGLLSGAAECHIGDERYGSSTSILFTLKYMGEYPGR